MSGVKIWEENVVIPSLWDQTADKNYVFESRVYQGSSGWEISVPDDRKDL